MFARHCEQSAGGRNAAARLGGHRPLDGDEIEELAERIDAEREGAALMQRYAGLPAIERAAIELVDLEELTPKEAALALGVSDVTGKYYLPEAGAFILYALTVAILLVRPQGLFGRG